MRKLNIIGKKVNKLTVIEQFIGEKNRTIVKCECECGNVKNFDGSKFNTGRIISCGCYIKSNEYKDSLSKRRRLDWGKSLENRTIQSYKNNAKRKGVPFELTNNQISTLFKGDCYYCGRKPYKTITKKNFYGDYTFNGIDRLINSDGYVKDNVVSCCYECNYLKNKYDEKEFIQLIRKIYENTKKY